MRPMNRTAAAARYAELPLPSTSEESWRFTDLAGFDPDAFASNGHVAVPAVARAGQPMLEIDVSGMALVGDGVVIEKAPEGVTFAPLGDHERLGTLVGADDKFTAHNAAAWTNGVLVHVPKGVVLDQPLYVRVLHARDGGATFFRLLVVA